MTDLQMMVMRTPLEGPARRLMRIGHLARSWRNPEFRDVSLEMPRIDRFLDRTVRGSFNCIDIGCHVGAKLSQFVRLAPAGRHMGFEPIPHLARRLQRKFPEV